VGLALLNTSQPRDVAARAVAGAPHEGEAGYDAATLVAGVRALEGRIVVRVVGDDRASFLHGMCSNDVTGAAPGTVVPALFLTEHAHVIADCFLWITAGAIMLEIDSALWTRVRAHLERLLVADDVEFEVEEADPLMVIDVEGARARDAIGGAAAALAEWRHIAAGDITIANLPRFGAAAFSILAPASKVESITKKLMAAVPGASTIGDDTLETIRIENGIARVGVDTGEKTIALEARMERAISFNKGCYLGQETIERATARGGLKKRLIGIRFGDGRVPGMGAKIRLGAKEVGVVSSVARSPRFGAIGLAIAQQAAWAPGTAVTIVAAGEGAEEIAGEVSELPFSSS
jgi:folate-binding protein YgfZ